MADKPKFASAMNNGRAALATGNTARDGTGSNFVDVLTGAAAGTRIDEVRVTATGTTTVGFVRLWHDVAGTRRLIREIAVTALTPSASVAAFSSSITFKNFRLASAEKLVATTHNSETFHVVAFGADYT